MSKSVIDLSPGITTIVGPNGCGKTNIVDALRWTLGEQKPSVLRSGKMEDVIFNGTKTRKQSGFCEVTIHINNDKNLLPIEFDSVSVRRRYYRTGESIYYLNNTKCRLKDIQDLFIDTGMSSDAYSVIELRMIDNIISPNTADRRRMFEEASGINKYKKQRRTSELRLANTSSNMDRIFDILNEVRNNVKSLKLQLKRYDRHEVLSKKLIELNIEHAKKEVYDLLQIKNPLDVNLKEITDKNKTLSLRLEKEEASLNKISNDYDIAAQQHSSLSGSIAVDREVLADVNNLLVKIHEQKKNSQLNIVQNSDEVRDLKEIISLNNKSLADYTNEIILVEQEVEKIESIVEQIKNQRDNFLSSLNKIKSDLKRKSKEKSIFDIDMTNIINEQFQIEYKISTEENQIKDSQISLGKADKLLTEIKKDKEVLNKKIKSIESKNTKANSLIEELSKEQSAIEQKISQSEANLIRLEKKLASIVQKIDFFDSLIASSDIDKNSISKILDKSSFGSPVFLGDVIVPNNKAIKKILVSILKDQSSYILIKSRKYLNKILKTIKSTNLTFIILDEVPIYDSAINIGKGNLLVENIKFDKIYSDIINHLFGEYVLIDSKKIDISRDSSCKYVTEEGIVFSSFIYHASSGNPDTSIIGRKDELVNLNNIKTEVEADIVKANKTINTLKNKANSIIKKIRLSEEKLDEGLDSYNSYYGKLTNINFQLNTKSDEIKSYKEILLSSDKRLIQNRLKLKVIKVEKKDIDKKVKNLSKKINYLSQKINKDSPQLDEMNDKVNIKNIVSMEKKKEKENLDFKIRTKKEEIERSETRISSLNNNNNILNDKIKEYEKIIKDNDLNKQNTITKIDKAEKERSEIEKIKDKLYSEVKKLQNSIYNLRQSKDELVDKTSKADIEIIDIKKNIEFIISKTYESYDFKINTDLSISDISADNMLAEKIISTEKSIENIGPINMAVRDEYDSENERLLFIENQYEDLVKSTNDLKITIKQLDGKAKDKFEQTFSVIKENFKKTFIDFFDGGEADIRLVDEKDPLNSDIEIYASPPGKTPKTIRMLSGGEKALTAIALLFAIYLVKPSPFCVLDEVDAPLDDKNIGKFTSVIKKFSDETQFIIVTHNKLTMTESNYLYGVTQQEPGISKIISAKIN